MGAMDPRRRPGSFRACRRRDRLLGGPHGRRIRASRQLDPRRHGRFEYRVSRAALRRPYVGLAPGLLVGAIAVWAVTSSALRSPPWALLARHAAQPALPSLAALVLIGSAIAAALAPYLGIALRGVDPKLPFLLSTVTLLATVVGLVYAERWLPMETSAEVPSLERRRGALPFFVALLLMAVGFQIHFSPNSAPRSLQLASAQRLPYLMPVFW